MKAAEFIADFNRRYSKYRSSLSYGDNLELTVEEISPAVIAVVQTMVNEPDTFIVESVANVHPLGPITQVCIDTVRGIRFYFTLDNEVWIEDNRYTFKLTDINQRILSEAITFVKSNHAFKPPASCEQALLAAYSCNFKGQN